MATFVIQWPGLLLGLTVLPVETGPRHKTTRANGSATNYPPPSPPLPMTVITSHKCHWQCPSGLQTTVMETPLPAAAPSLRRHSPLRCGRGPFLDALTSSKRGARRHGRWRRLGPPLHPFPSSSLRLHPPRKAQRLPERGANGGDASPARHFPANTDLHLIPDPNSTACVGTRTKWTRAVDSTTS